ncbi:MAG: YhbY family RNA-binding protein [Lachnospiraceae bacterium]|jgi:RNA-binding protein|nr:YhbY family RNA-binding protein [Lachnospiraceae bacterium]
MTSKQRAILSSQAHDLDPIYYVGKAGLTPELTDGIRDAFHTRELMKIGVQKNCALDPKDLATTIAERTHSQVVRVLGSKIILYKEMQKQEKTTRSTHGNPQTKSRTFGRHI